jgi:ATP-binding cassette subfamily B (MDR/TAP) protein 1
MALIFWYGGHLLTDNKINATQLWIIYLAVLACGQSAGEVFANSSSSYCSYLQSLTTSNTRSDLFQAKHAINTVLNMIKNASNREGDQPRADREERGSLVPPNSITFRDVNFSYPNAPHCRVLEDINVSIGQGQNIAVVGPSGSGKSTIIALLEKFYDVDSGSILIGPDPLNTLSTATYRKTVSLVSQDTLLFQGTLRENILLGVPDTTTNEQLEAAAKDANIHDFIMSLPEGYNTQCGIKGMEFSGGQRQRIAIACALIRRPSILLLDEATSALDSLSEIEVLEALKRVHKETTTITVAHRLATIRDADLILVLVKGRIVERGNHAQLLQKRGTYWTMCQAQALDREL